MSTRILVADDHAIFAEGLCALLENETDFETVGQVNDGGEAVRLSRKLVPDVVIMDLSMPGMNGIDATRLIKAEQPKVHILCLSMHTDRGFVMGALNAGGSGYVAKNSAKKELVQAIHTVMRNDVYLSASVATLVVDAAISHSDSPSVAQLTHREREVLQMLSEGSTTREIAEQLHVSVKTVGTHRVHVMDKLGLKSVAALTKFAIREGLTFVSEDRA